MSSAKVVLRILFIVKLARSIPKESEEGVKVEIFHRRWANWKPLEGLKYL
jgi:hypothetical protein